MLLRKFVKSTFIKCPSVNFPCALNYSIVSNADQKLASHPYRTSEDSPTNQNINHIGKYYTIPTEIKKQVYTYGGFPKKYETLMKAFAEPMIMVREPALEIINYIKNTNLSKTPTIRYVLYGKDGVGKSLTLAHLLHFGQENDFILVHVPWLPNWFKFPKETASSTSKEGFTDIPLDSAAWLIQFKLQNLNLLTKLNLKCSQDYVWTKREITGKDAPLLDLIEHGIARIKFASETIEALLNELKMQSTLGNCKTMVAIDGYNAFFHRQTRIIGENKTKITPDKVMITQPFLNITNYDWTNGVCILVVDRLALTVERMASELPRYLLYDIGFEHLDPFVPVLVSNYTDREYENCVDLYLEKRWIQNTTDGFREELKYLSGKNPYTFMQMCASL